MRPVFHPLVEITLLSTTVCSCAMAAPASSSTTSNDTYVITNVRSGLAIEDPGASPGGIDHTIQAGAVSGRSDQIWKIEGTPDGYWTLQNTNSGAYVSCTTDLKWVAQYSYSGSPYQQWRIDHNPDGSCVLTNRGSSYCLNVFEQSTSAGAWLNMDVWKNDPSEEWTLRPGTTK